MPTIHRRRMRRVGAFLKFYRKSNSVEHHATVPLPSLPSAPLDLSAVDGGMASLSDATTYGHLSPTMGKIGLYDHDGELV